ncbi:MAG: hypothetical protein J7623_16890 [Chitinophaga sp.]|uniref:hypothetical protein n=1 Tax=Chitinophaga sp. TaxID=1869181 RepID=UPI001B077EAA|nr:hypothetical protein [Chitinophaga sp.]MBO9730319.1 hypothetical protein [Chitinophaga sp.]
MTRVKAVSKILYYLSKILALGYLVTTAYAIICLLTNWNIAAYGDGHSLHIFYPFTGRPFLNIASSPSYIIFSFLVPLVLYSVFFQLASGVFKVFYQPKLFSLHHITQLRRFYLLNSIAPGIAALCAALFVSVQQAVWVLVIVHLFLGAFAWFMAAIFKQGLRLQNEQDLFI